MLTAHRLKNSFIDACRGLSFVFQTEQNFRLQTGVALLMLILILLLPLLTWERLLVLVLILFVLVLEIINTAFEQFCDLLKPRLHHQIKIVKDLMAAAVFLTSLFSAVIGLIIIAPYLVNLFR